MTTQAISQFMTVAQLRRELERLERNGCGAWDIDVAPDPYVADGTRYQTDLAFDARRHGVVRLVPLGDGSVDFVLLTFAAGPVAATESLDRPTAA
ncbi:hypothetical protein GCM10009557_03090 [Virgisporangium ochraceum]|uniref:Uncharacterized protein n=1 Tax=Virgisporangium ochraceum TaxID=65505 RepID=A0A8J3ZV18_9ACTN|nr:hypothetical protein [Virgisporangium ochraceum]GIJ67971.1 hypothetical protein Voc01_028880 [Virgisporangium ochraceum]